jgi:hypothetical protein
VRDGQSQSITVYLDGNREISVDVKLSPIKGLAWLSVGGGPDDGSAFEGKIDEVALYNRTLMADEILGHVRAASLPAMR